MQDHNDPLRNVPSLTVAPPARCHYRGESSLGTVCGEIAVWMRPARDWFMATYFCDEHRAPTDVELPAVHAIRRVRFNAICLFAAATNNQALAHTEALARLDAAVQHAGGLIDVEDVHSTWGKSCPPPRLGRANGSSIDHR